MMRIQTPLHGSVTKISIARRNRRWDVKEEGMPFPVVDFPRKDDAMDYALCLAARAQIAIVELRDQVGTLLFRQEFHRHADGRGMSPLRAPSTGDVPVAAVA
jgi:hypothetical protein